MSLTRRGAMGSGLALLAAPAAAQGARDAAPPASDVDAWSRYEARLRARLEDAGGGRYDEAGAAALTEMTNAERARSGARPLSWHAELARAARAHAADLAERAYLEHLAPEGFDPSHRFWLLGRTTIGSPSENIAYHRGSGPPVTPTQLLELWRSSPGHWRNLLRPSHTHVGYGLIRRADRSWLVGLYAQPVAALAEPLPFRADAAQVARALASLDGQLRPRIAIPQGSRIGLAGAAPPVMQITALRRAEVGRFDVIGGPIFQAAEARARA
ncbi:MAG: CAP domain-containing protein [Pseudomonadota bacterium]